MITLVAIKSGGLVMLTHGLVANVRGRIVRRPELGELDGFIGKSPSSWGYR